MDPTHNDHNSEVERKPVQKRGDRPGMGRKVAVIEDDPSTAALLSTLLQLEGYVAQSIDNVPEVGALLEEAKVDFVLCDDNMPGLRGHEVISAIRGAGLQVPIVLMSGMYVEEHDWRDLKANGFLLKPFTRQELLDALRAAESQDEGGESDGFQQYNSQS